MNQRIQSVVWAAMVVGASSSPSLAWPISYGDFGPDFPPGVTMYQDVQESAAAEPVPPERFGAPTLRGDELDFDQISFVASATGGTSATVDGQLSFGLGIDEINNVLRGGMTSVLLTEFGEYSLSGSGTAATQVGAAMSVTVGILQVDGSPITPINLSLNSSATRDLVADGPGDLVPWSHDLLVDFGPVLAANNIDFDYGVTKAQLVIDHQLFAAAEPNSGAFIANGDFAIRPAVQMNPALSVPEPSGFALAIVAAAALCAAATGRRKAAK